MLLLDGVRRALYVRISTLAGLARARAATHFRRAISGESRTAVERVFRTVAAPAAPGLLSVVCVQRFLAAISCEIRLVASLGIVSGPSRGVPKEFGFFDPLRPGQITNHGFFLLPLENDFSDRWLPAVEIWVSVVQSHYL